MGKRTAGGSRFVSFVALLALTAGLFGTFHADAQSQSGWIDPTGTLELSYAATGWRENNPRLSAQRHDLELVGPSFSASHLTLCAVLKPSSAGLLDGGTQEQINAKMRGKTAAEISPGLEKNPTLRFEHRMIDGVTVTDFRFSQAQSTQRWIAFRIPAVVGATQYSVVCRADEPISAREQADMDAIMASIRIRRKN